MLEHFELVQQLNTNSSLDTYRALDRRNNRLVLLRRIHTDQGLELLERFEALKGVGLAGLPWHLECFVVGGQVVTVTEYIQGTCLLKQSMDNQALAGKLLPAKLCVDSIIQIAHILEALHAHRPRAIVHGAVKPSNMIESGGTLYLVGCERAPGRPSHLSRAGMLGRYGGIAPEQFRGTANTRSDQYGLAASLHHLLTGVASLPGMLEPLENVRMDLPHDLVWVVRKATQTQPEERFDSIFEFRRQLESARQQIG